MPESKDPNPFEVGYVPDEKDAAEEPAHPKKNRSGAGQSAAELRRKVDKLEKALKKQTEIFGQVQAERNELQDKYLRNLAEMDNFRKRISKEKEDYQRFVLGEFLLGLLEVYDNFERAIRAHSQEDSPRSIISGVQMIFKQLQELLRKNKVEELNPDECPFDPNFHQALSREEREGVEDPVVVEVYQKGFLYNEKLLRPALVRVAVPPSPAPADDNHQGESS